MLGYELVQISGTDDTTAKMREPYLKKTITETPEGTVITWEWIDDQYDDIKLREHRRIATKPFGRPLEMFRSLEELLLVLQDIVNSE